MASPPEVAVAVAMLAEIFHDGPSERGVNLYARALADLPTVALTDAVDRLIRDHERFFPTPAEIRAAAGFAGDDAASGALPLFPPDPRSLDQIADTRRRLAPLWGEVRRVFNGGELRPFAEVMADLDAGRLGTASLPAPAAPRRPAPCYVADGPDDDRLATGWRPLGDALGPMPAIAEEERS
ncbi:MAG TPA: hypothetical protein VMS01_04360 [Stellaceae bacterium]|nr:hypothetical protein [Stellaceae bacterium]